jgi:NADH-quinone oxidoreductase subunit C
MTPSYGSRYPEPEAIAAAVNSACRDAVLSHASYRQETTLCVRRESIVDVCRFLHSSPEWKFQLLADIAGVDWPSREKRFDVVYNLYSPDHNLRLRLKVQVALGEEVPSITSVYRSADWAEREVYDMFGVTFSGHPDPRRILMPDDWEGHPLRKDFPLSYELPQFTHNLSARPEWLEEGLRWFGSRQYGAGRPQISVPRQGPEGKPVAGWEGRPPEEQGS